MLGLLDDIEEIIRRCLISRKEFGSIPDRLKGQITDEKERFYNY
jgi:hypothetical protein